MPLMLGMALMVQSVLIIHSVCDSHSISDIVETGGPIDFSDFGDTGADVDSGSAVGVIGSGNVHSTGCTGGSCGDSADGAGDDIDDGNNSISDGPAGHADNCARY